MCSRFIEDFANKVAEKACCEACLGKTKLCKALNNQDFRYFSHETCLYVDPFVQFLSDRTTRKKIEQYYIDILLSCLHNREYYMFIQILFRFQYEEKMLDLIKNKIKNHLICITDSELVVSHATDNWKNLNGIDIRSNRANQITFKAWLIIFFDL